MITDIDLSLSRSAVAAGGELQLRNTISNFMGTPSSADQCGKSRFLRASPGKIVHYHPPGGLGVRVDSAVYHGYAIPRITTRSWQAYCARQDARRMLMRLKRALDEFVIDGIETTLPLFRALVREKDIIDGDYHIHCSRSSLPAAACVH
jgi:acetyl-CoA carboxylase biotin carboxylase subunit